MVGWGVVRGGVTKISFGPKWGRSKKSLVTTHLTEPTAAIVILYKTAAKHDTFISKQLCYENLAQDMSSPTPDNVATWLPELSTFRDSGQTEAAHSHPPPQSHLTQSVLAVSECVVMLVFTCKQAPWYLMGNCGCGGRAYLLSPFTMKVLPECWVSSFFITL